MDWTRSIDAYCERTDASLWSEPVNALTNLAFLFAAAVMWPRVRGLRTGQVLCVILAAIGLGSFLFHTHATAWAALTDVVPIAAFILAYVFAASRDFLRLPVWGAALAAAGFVPWAAVLVPVFAGLPFFADSAAYWPVPLLILLYAALLARRAPATARGLAIGAVVLVASLTFRTLDEPLCAAIPFGTHFLWHLLNGLMLGWMIEVWRRHVTAPPLAARAPRG